MGGREKEEVMGEGKGGGDGGGEEVTGKTGNEKLGVFLFKKLSRF